MNVLILLLFNVETKPFAGSVGLLAEVPHCLSCINNIQHLEDMILPVSFSFNWNKNLWTLVKAIQLQNPSRLFRSFSDLLKLFHPHLIFPHFVFMTHL